MPLQKLLSSQLVPSGWKPSAGQSSPTPSQHLRHVAGAGRGAAGRRALGVARAQLRRPVAGFRASQTPAEARQVVPLGSTASAGHAGLTPSQVSAASQVSPVLAARHTVLLGSTASAGQVWLTPSQFSTTSQIAGRGAADGRARLDRIGRAVPRSSRCSSRGCRRPRRRSTRGRRLCWAGSHPPGSSDPTPVQASATSQTPATARHSVPPATKSSAGQAVLTPSHASATSQAPAAARHSAPATRSCRPGNRRWRRRRPRRRHSRRPRRGTAPCSWHPPGSCCRRRRRPRRRRRRPPRRGIASRALARRSGSRCSRRRRTPRRRRRRPRRGTAPCSWRPPGSRRRRRRRPRRCRRRRPRRGTAPSSWRPPDRSG